MKFKVGDRVRVLGLNDIKKRESGLLKGSSMWSHFLMIKGRSFLLKTLYLISPVNVLSIIPAQVPSVLSLNTRPERARTSI